MVMSLNCLGQMYLVPSLRLARQLQQMKKPRERRVRRNALLSVLSRLFLRVGCSRFYIAGFCHISGSFPVLFLRDAETIPGVSGNEELSTGVETDGQLRGRHIVVSRSLVPMAGGPSMMSLRLSTVKVEAGSCWRGHLMVVILVLE